MPAWLSWLIGILFGGTKQSATDQRLGQVEQQRDDAAAGNQEAQRATQIDTDVGDESDSALDAELQQPPRSDRPGRKSARSGGE